ncbi:hypothetical protein WG66_000837 [Moniliophthora roreri]|nr:hypothetical protein WG66_000837 [Moniliophthora roreri]
MPSCSLSSPTTKLTIITTPDHPLFHSLSGLNLLFSGYSASKFFCDNDLARTQAMMQSQASGFSRSRFFSILMSFHPRLGQCREAVQCIGRFRLWH